MIIHSEQEMLDFGQEFARNISKLPVVIELLGDVGAGKTTFVRGFAKGLGINDPVTSPSFTISKSYAIKNGGFLVHYDFYRLPDPGIMKEDLAENLKNQKNIILIEWSDSVKKVLPKNHIRIEILKLDDDSREIKVDDSQESTFRGISRPTGSELARSPITMGATKRAEKSAFRLYLDTSTPLTILKLNDKEYKYEFNNDLAEKLLSFIRDKLEENGKAFEDLTEITFMSGPGSFTGLRIGAAIVNTLSSELNIPLYNHKNERVKIILPDYGSEANISKPKK